MLQHSDHKRLLVFSDNRQDAAFQAGWMQDHARRFRLRSLMYERLMQGAVSVGDLSAHLCDLLEQNFLMLQPREHSAQVPAEDHEHLERDFKSEGNRVNTLVCTPTLELGVDMARWTRCSCGTCRR
jgi:Lhr-like helicase